MPPLAVAVSAMHARSVPLERVSRAIGGWFTGVCVGLFGSILVAWAVNAWHEYRWGISVGLLTIAIVFWGLVLGVSSAVRSSPYWPSGAQEDQPLEATGRPPLHP